MTESVVSPSAAGGLSSYYEQFSAGGSCNRSKAPRIIGWNDTKKEAVIFRPPCNQWVCEVCGPTLRAKASIRAYLGAKEALDSGDALNFLTVTSHEKLPAWRAWEVMPKAWDRLNRRAKRRQPDGQYFAVREFTERGIVHMHAITTYDLGKRFWKDAGRACGLGYMADVDAVRSPPGAGAYVLKYLFKASDGPSFTKGARRYNASRGWPALPDLDKADGWQFAPIPRDITNQYIMREWSESGFDVRLLEKGQKLKDLESIFGEISLEAQNAKADNQS